jgi:hypothetical protein
MGFGHRRTVNMIKLSQRPIELKKEEEKLFVDTNTDVIIPIAAFHAMIKSLPKVDFTTARDQISCRIFETQDHADLLNTLKITLEQVEFFDYSQNVVAAFDKFIKDKCDKTI